MSDLETKVQKSIERLKAFEPEEGYYLAFSGGKDSVACKALLDMSGCKYDSTFIVTSVDPPELLRFIKDKHPDVKREVPRYSNRCRKERAGKPITMWNLIPYQRTPPTRRARYCCKYLKEANGDGRMTVTGVRWAESINRQKNQGEVVIRSKGEVADYDSEDFRLDKLGSLILVNDNTESRRLVEQCYKRHKTTVNPIIDWSDSDVWDFIRSNGIPYCELYDEGFTRIGCIGCPLGRTKQRERQFARWPTYKNAYLHAFDEMLKKCRESGKPFLSNLYGDSATAEDVYNWWMEYKVSPDQYSLFEDDGDEDQEVSE